MLSEPGDPGSESRPTQAIENKAMIAGAQAAQAAAVTAATTVVTAAAAAMQVE